MGSTQAPINTRTGAIAAVAELGEEAMALLRADLHPLDFVALLMENALFPDAVRFIAHALPKREAVWWAWVGARRSGGENPQPKIKNALDATEKWIARPNDDNRRTGMGAGQNAQPGTAAGHARRAAY